jgi:hypothetical protein
MVALPVIAVGCAGRLVTFTAKVCAVLLPHPLFATTEIVPPVVPAVVLIELVVDVPDQPEGSVHV